MSPLLLNLVVVPGTVALVFLLVVTYLQRQTREPQFHFWQAVWFCYLLHIIATGLSTGFPDHAKPFNVISRLSLASMALLLLVSGRRLLLRDRALLNPMEIALGVVGTAWAVTSVLDPLA